MSDRYENPGQLARRNGLILMGTILFTFGVLRFALGFSPDSDFDVAGHNIHHLFTGLVLIALGGIPLAIFRGHTRWLGAALVVFGVGLGMALDEWVYLIATDGSNASYLLPVSFWGGVTAVSLACVYAVLLVGIREVRLRRSESKKLD